MPTFTRRKVVNKVVALPIDKIRPNPAQPRKVFDAYELISLAESIKINGLLQPITVRKREEYFELISGERRMRACKIAKLSTIPCIIVEKSDEESAVLALLENIQRQDLHYLEQAQGLRKLIECWGITQEEAARRLGLAQSTLANKLRLLGMNKEAQVFVVNEGLTERHARALLSLPKDKQLEAAQVIAERGFNVSQGEAYIASLLEDEKPKLNKKRLFIVKDVRIFMNTVSKAVDMMKQAGVEAVANTKESDEFIEYNIRIPIKKNAS